MLIKILLLFVINILPLPATPGCLCTTADPDFLQLRYPTQIPYCQRHLLKSTQDAVAKLYGVAEENYSQYEFDHLIPLSIGGTNQACNIWPEPLPHARQKDKLEDALYLKMKKGQIKQSDAVSEIHAWLQAHQN